MTDKPSSSRNTPNADWFMRGVLARLGDKIDVLLGRRWSPSSSLATSELIERLKNLLDAEAKTVAGKGIVAPHNIKLKMQWDKFSTDAEDALGRLETELLAAAADHINDSLYYTYAPLVITVAPDYFTEGVKLYVSFEDFSEEQVEAEMNVTMPLLDLRDTIEKTPPADAPEMAAIYSVEFTINGVRNQKKLRFPVGSHLTVGRTRTSDLMLDDISVSNIHASLASKDSVLSVADTGSTNGTFINDERIPYGKAVELSEGDRLRFGVVEATFQLVTNTDPDNSDDDGSIGIAEPKNEPSASPELSQVPIIDETFEIDPDPEAPDTGSKHE